MLIRVPRYDGIYNFKEGALYLTLPWNGIVFYKQKGHSDASLI